MTDVALSQEIVFQTEKVTYGKVPRQKKGSTHSRKRKGAKKLGQKQARELEKEGIQLERWREAGSYCDLKSGFLNFALDRPV